MEVNCGKNKELIIEYIKMIEDKRQQFYRNYNRAPVQISSSIDMKSCNIDDCNLSITSEDDIPNLENSMVVFGKMNLKKLSSIHGVIKKKSSINKRASQIKSKSYSHISSLDSQSPCHNSDIVMRRVTFNHLNKANSRSSQNFSNSQTSFSFMKFQIPDSECLSISFNEYD